MNGDHPGGRSFDEKPRLEAQAIVDEVFARSPSAAVVKMRDALSYALANARGGAPMQDVIGLLDIAWAASIEVGAEVDVLLGKLDAIPEGMEKMAAGIREWIANQ